MDALETHPEAEEAFRGHLAGPDADSKRAIAVLDTLVRDHRRRFRALGARIVLGDRGQAVLATVDSRRDTPSWDAYVRLAIAAHTALTLPDTETTAAVQPLLVERVERLCAQAPAAPDTLDCEPFVLEANGLRSITRHSPDEAIKQLAHELLAISRQQTEPGTAVDHLLADVTIFGKDILENFGLPASLEADWAAGYGQAKLPDNKPDPDCWTLQQYRHACVRSILDIERQLPGASRRLHRLLGTRNFARVTCQQAEAILHAKPGQHTTILLAPIAQDCDNGAMLHASRAVATLSPGLLPNILAVPVEITHADEILERLQFLERAWRIYSTQTRIGAIFLAGHGIHDDSCPDHVHSSIMLSSQWLRSRRFSHELHADELDPEVYAILGRLCATGASLFVNACEGAAGEENIVRTLHERTGLNAAGSPEITGLYALEVSEQATPGLLVDGMFATTRADTQNNYWVIDRMVDPKRYSQDQALAENSER